VLHNKVTKFPPPLPKGEATLFLIGEIFLPGIATMIYSFVHRPEGKRVDLSFFLIGMSLFRFPWSGESMNNSNAAQLTNTDDAFAEITGLFQLLLVAVVAGIIWAWAMGISTCKLNKT